MEMKKRLPLAAAIAGLMLQAGAANAETFELEEIVVTAQKRAQSLQDVPLSVNAVSGEMISEMNMTGLDDMSSYVPNLTISESTTSTNIYIRGFGSGANVGFEQSVGMYIDGVYGGRDRQFRAPFLDLERVEVLRGPQGILFGKNTIAGAINIATAKPTQEFEANIKAEIEPRYDQHKVSAVISGGLSDTVSGRLAVSNNQSDGFFDNTLADKDGPAKDEQVIRGTLVWDFSDETEITLKAETGSFDVKGNNSRLPVTTSVPGMTINPGILAQINGQPGALWLANPGINALRQEANANNGVVAPTSTGDFADLMRANDPAYKNDEYTQSADRDKSETDNDNIVLTVEHDFNDFTFTSITGYSAYEAEDVQDVDFSPIDFLDRVATQDFDQISQEFRITSPLDDKFEYIAGFYYQSTDLETTNRQNSQLSALSGYRNDLDLILGPTLGSALYGNLYNGFAPGPIPILYTLATLPDTATMRDFEQESETYAVFGQFTWHIRDDLHATLGLRYSREEKEAERSVYAIDPVTGARTTDAVSIAALNATTGHANHTVKEDLTESNWTPSINVSWDYNEDVMLYTSATIGYKGGGFNEAGVDDPNNGGNPFGFDEEKATSFEVGGKFTLLDGAARLNVAAFHTEYDDLQTSTFTSNGFTVGNAGSAVSQGVEVDGMWRLTEALTFSGSAAFLDAEYDEFEGAGCTVTQGALFATGSRNCSQDLSGEELIFSPEWSASLALDHVQPLMGDLELRSRIDANFTDNQYLTTDLDPTSEESAHTIYNLRLALAPSDNRWEVALVAKNLTDKETRNFAADTPLLPGSYIGYYGAPRTISLTGMLSF